MEVIQLVEVSAEELNRAINIIKWAIRELGISEREVFIYITDDHNRVRELLGLDKVSHEEWPIKYMRSDDTDVISIVPTRLSMLSNDDVSIMALRETALVRVMNDPVLISIWNPRPDIGDPLIHRVSLALLRRVVDFVIAQSESLTRYLVSTFNRDEVRNLLLTCEPTVDCAITVLALDVPLSIEATGNAGLGRSLWHEVSKSISNEFSQRYDDFRDFVRNNFNVEYAYNYLLTIFRRPQPR